jgi:hypothetical protein
MLSDTNRVVYAICKCILYPQSNVLVSFQDEKSATDAFKIAKKLCRNNQVIKEILDTNNNSINFKNESNLAFEFHKPKVEPEYIRGQRLKLPLLYYDDFHIDEETLNEVLQPYIKKESNNE